MFSSDPAPAQSPWPRHVIDQGSRGADGVRLGDVNRDGRVDVVTGWEEGGQIRVCLQPPLHDLRAPWPVVVVGRVASPEDAVFADVNGDAWLDVVSCCEGRNRTVWLHVNPGGDRLQDSAAWTTHELAGTAEVTRWMFCVPLAVSGDPSHPPALILGSKNPAARITLARTAGDSSPPVTLRPAGWIMSLRVLDMDRDGDDDVLYSDRKRPHRGIGWLEHPGPAREVSSSARWSDHRIGAADAEFMFLDVGPAAPGGAREIACQTSRNGIRLFSADADSADGWRLTVIAPRDDTGTGKGIAIGDIDSDGDSDLVASCEHAEDRIGVYWLERPDQAASASADANWTLHDISGRERGVKFDRIELLDLDRDGDLDVMTCEERDNLGVIWYENPGRY